jgi:hypothetical protein
VRVAAVFKTTGVDMAGPLFLRDGWKVWVCLYNCAVYHAVHLELVLSLSTDSFIQTFYSLWLDVGGQQLSTATMGPILWA